MTLRRWSLAIALCAAGACRSSRIENRLKQVQAEALTDESTIRARCERPDDVIAGRALCVLRDLPRQPAY